MKPSILVTGASGYLGGTLLANWKAANLDSLYDQVHALVRTSEQAEAVKQYGAVPIQIDLEDEVAVADTLVSKGISVVAFMIGVMDTVKHKAILKGLSRVSKETGLDVHFIYSSGAKLYSGMAGAPVDRVFADNDPSLYDTHKAQRARWQMLQGALSADVGVVDMAESYGVKSYVFIPCIVYGKGEGFGNPISIQVVDLVNSAVAAGRVFSLSSNKQMWPVCHVKDNTSLYLQIVRQILEGKNLGHGKQGYYLASSGSIAWSDLYAAFASALAKRGRISNGDVLPADDAALTAAAGALGTLPDMVELQIGGHCALTTKHGQQIGWKPEYKPEHILEVAVQEVELILAVSDGKSKTKLK